MLRPLLLLLFVLQKPVHVDYDYINIEVPKSLHEQLRQDCKKHNGNVVGLPGHVRIDSLSEPKEIVILPCRMVL